MPCRSTDDEFIRAWRALGSIHRVSKELGVAPQMIARRRRSIERRHGITLVTVDAHNRKVHEAGQPSPSCELRRNITIKNGIMIVGSDGHIWPGKRTIAQRAFITLSKKLKPKVVILNGDILDGARISRHDRIGWEVLPSVMDELKAVQAFCREVEQASKGSLLLRTRGNHDMRFEKFLGMNAVEFREVAGFKLSDHLPAWQESWSIWINDDVIVKHRWHNGIHAVYNNVVKGGMTIITGHLHSLKTTPWTNFKGTNYGVDTGTLADPWGPQFEYMEDGARNWRSGLGVFTFRDGVLMPPELCEVVGTEAIFRGEPV